MSELPYENAYVRVYRWQNWIVLEEKAKQNTPVERSVEIGAEPPPDGLNCEWWSGPTSIWVDMGTLPDGTPCAVRWYFPESFPEKVIIRKAESLAESYRKRLAMVGFGWQS